MNREIGYQFFYDCSFLKKYRLHYIEYSTIKSCYEFRVYGGVQIKQCNRIPVFFIVLNFLIFFTETTDNDDLSFSIPFGICSMSESQKEV